MATEDKQSDSSCSDAASFPFLRFPLELQYHFCSLLCRHCHRPASPAVTLFEVAGPSFTTLKALSETCHTLKEIAQPILYHYPDVKTYTPFFKTVIAKPALAASVKVLARLYESDWRPFWRQPKRFSKEDITYLIKLAQGFDLHDGVGDEDDHWESDDANFKRCFQNLNGEGDFDGFTTDLAFQAFFSLLTALHFAILPRLDFAMIDMYDGMSSQRLVLPQSGHLLLSYPYLPKVVATKPDHFLHLDTIVFRRSYHYRLDSLGLERIAFLLPAIPNIRVAFFDRLHGEKRGYYQERRIVPSPELSWRALPRLEEIYFDPCARPKDPAPLDAISRMLQRCPRLMKLVYGHKHPDQYKPPLFSPAALLDAILSTKERLQQLELYCSNAKIPLLSKETLLDFHLKEFTALRTLVLDEELFCHHWLSDSCQDSCLINILPENISSLTVRLHDKFKAVPDIVQLGKRVALGYYSQLSRLRVNVLQDRLLVEDDWNGNGDPNAFDSGYLLYGISDVLWAKTLRELAADIRPTVSIAFQHTKVAVEVEYVLEINFSDARVPVDKEYLW